MRKTVFGEGAEKMVHKFRFIDSQSKKFVGDNMVAKESRFVDENKSYKQRMNYHREFMRTQAIASRMAAKFNEAIDALSSDFPGHDACAIVGDHYRRNLPRINFLAPLVVEVRDVVLGNYCMLIEPMLDVAKYEKFNNNMGYVKGQTRQVVQVDLLLGFGTCANPDGDGLVAIEEGSEENEEDEEDDDFLKFVRSKADTNTTSFDFEALKECDFPHAFSHFSYQISKGSLMVVDLQGVLTVRRNGTIYELTDPVIHKKKSKRRFRNWNFGGTDRGEKGIKTWHL
jgi:hypothetical protein